MDNTLTNILVYTSIGSLAALVGGLVLLSREKLMLKISHLLAPFAAGVLLATAFLDLLPEAAHEAEEAGINIFLWTLLGILVFFLLERFIHAFHHHEEYHDEREQKSVIPLVIAGDTMHNFLDGVVIAATFMTSAPLGVVTAFAVFAHELPQEIGDFGLMLHKGLKKRKIIMVNVLSAAVSFIGALLTYAMGDTIRGILPILLSITAGFFIYIAASDLIPEIHHETRKGFAFYESLLLIAGILVIYLVIGFLPHEG